jgi:deoxyhypusine synthase
MAKTRDSHRYGTGQEDGLAPLAPLDAAATHSVDALVRAMSQTAFGGRRLGEAADVYEAMVRDPDCFRVVTISGAMTIAKQGLLLCEMIDRGWVNAVVTTGALMTHGLSEGAGMLHFKHRPSMSDEVLYQRGYNRVYDTIELEKNLDDVELLLEEALDGMPDDAVLSSHSICEALGRVLAAKGVERAILKSAVERGVPVFVPAFTDSELGLDVAIYNRVRVGQGRAPYRFDPYVDLEAYTDRIRGSERLGIFTIGGGVPRNWAQQVGPYLEILRGRLGVDCRRHANPGSATHPKP